MSVVSDALNELAGLARLPMSRRQALVAGLAALETNVAALGNIATPGATGGAKIRRLVVDGDLAVPAGNITVGPVATGKGNVIINGDGLRTRLGTVEKIKLSTLGDVFIGSDLLYPASTYFSIFSIQQNYNSENFLAGDMLIGDNSASKANIKWDKANGQLKFRGGTTTQLYIDVTGALMAGGGNVRLDSAGVSIAAQNVNFYDTTSFTNNITQLFAFTAGSHVSTGLAVNAFGATFTDAQIQLQTYDTASTGAVSVDINSFKTGNLSDIRIYGLAGTLSGLIVGANAVPNTMLDVRGSATATGGLNLGTGSGAATGAINATGAQPTHLITKSSAGILEGIDLLGNSNASNWRFLVDDSTGSGGLGTSVMQIWYGAQAVLKLTTTGGLTVGAGFGANNAAPQTKAASGGAAPAGGTGTAAGGWDTSAHRDSAITLLNNIRTALVNNGIMS